MVRPAEITPEEREGMRLAYMHVPSLHDRSFEQCLEDPIVFGCLWHTALAARRAAEQKRQLDPANFELRP